MKNFITLSALASLAWAAPPASPVELAERSTPSALYFLDNDLSGCNIISMAIGSNGELSQPRLTATGGKGSLGVNDTLNDPSLEAPATVDGLYSQGSIVSAGNFLFSVNAGSSTLSAFEINPEDPTEITLVGTPIDTLGDFPNSVTYSEALQLACVCNTAATNGVACFKFIPNHGLVNHTPLMVPGLISQTTPPISPEYTYSEVLWNPTSEFLVATIKGSGNFKNQNVTSSIVYIGWNRHTNSFNEPVITKFDDVYEAFGFNFIDDNTIWMVDPNFGGSIISFGSDGTATEEVHTVIATQIQTCWSNWDRSLGRLYGFAGGQNGISELTLSGEFLGYIVNGNTGDRIGTFDNVIHNGLLYTLIAGGNGVSVIDLGHNSTVQFFDTTEMAPNRQYYEGMAKYPTSGY